MFFAMDPWDDPRLASAHFRVGIDMLLKKVNSAYHADVMVFMEKSLSSSCTDYRWYALSRGPLAQGRQENVRGSDEDNTGRP